MHGHDFSCLACLPSQQAQDEPDRVLYASGSEEKVLRVLEAPQAFLDTLRIAQQLAPSFQSTLPTNAPFNVGFL